jgi:prevent-host-death family protein
MRTVPVREAKAKFSELIDAAEKGEEIMITRHGKPAAVIISGMKSAQAAPVKPKSFVDFLMEFPGGSAFERSAMPSRETDF